MAKAPVALSQRRRDMRALRIRLEFNRSAMGILLNHTGKLWLRPDATTSDDSSSVKHPSELTFRGVASGHSIIVRWIRVNDFLLWILGHHLRECIHIGRVEGLIGGRRVLGVYSGLLKPCVRDSR